MWRKDIGQTDRQTGWQVSQKQREKTQECGLCALHRKEGVLTCEECSPPVASRVAVKASQGTVSDHGSVASLEGHPQLGPIQSNKYALWEGAITQVG